MMAARWLTLLWFVLTLVVLGFPGETLPDPGVVGLDKVAHVTIFAIGTVIALIGWPREQLRVVAVLLVFAPLAEVWQAVLPTGRDANVPDALANTAGVALGWILWRWRPLRR